MPSRDGDPRETVGRLSARISDPAAHQLLVGLIGEAVSDAGVRDALCQRIRRPFAQRLVDAVTEIGVGLLRRGA